MTRAHHHPLPSIKQLHHALYLAALPHGHKDLEKHPGLTAVLTIDVLHNACKQETAPKMLKIAFVEGLLQLMKARPDLIQYASGVLSKMVHADSRVTIDLEKKSQKRFIGLEERRHKRLKEVLHHLRQTQRQTTQPEPHLVSLKSFLVKKGGPILREIVTMDNTPHAIQARKNAPHLATAIIDACDSGSDLARAMTYVMDALIPMGTTNPYAITLLTSHLRKKIHAVERSSNRAAKLVDLFFTSGIATIKQPGSPQAKQSMRRALLDTHKEFERFGENPSTPDATRQALKAIAALNN